MDQLQTLLESFKAEKQQLEEEKTRLQREFEGKRTELAAIYASKEKLLEESTAKQRAEIEKVTFLLSALNSCKRSYNTKET